MTSPQTLIPDYKLKMNVLSLQYHWNPILTEALSKEELIFETINEENKRCY